MAAGGARADLEAWLARKGVRATKVREVMHISGCMDLDSLWLRVQLPPLAYANDDAVVQHMWELFGVRKKVAWQIIDELDVSGALMPSRCCLHDVLRQWKGSTYCSTYCWLVCTHAHAQAPARLARFSARVKRKMCLQAHST
jgi:hypothetical protein